MAIAGQPVLSFAGLLRQLRAEAGLTQEQLAETAGLGARTFSDLERGVHRSAHQDTARLLAGALRLAEPTRGLFVAAARGRVSPDKVLAAKNDAPAAQAAVAAGTLPASVFPGNIPVRLSSFVGRAAELARLAAAVRKSPLVTVTGPGGVGKTRLAVHAATDHQEAFADGAWLCELAAASDGESMAQVVVTALRVRPRPGLSTAASVVEFLRTRTSLLLLLDNCEHLLVRQSAMAS